MYEELVKTLWLRAALWEKMYDENNVLKQAADAIEELQKAVYFHKYNSEFWEDKYNSLADEKWIPVTERLPADGLYVLAYSADDDFTTVEARNRFGAFQITHWMPLPEPPKEET